MRHILFITLLSLLPLKAFSFTGDELLSFCQESVKFMEDLPVEDESHAKYCFGLLEGIRNMNTFRNERLSSGKYFCVPKEVTTGQLVYELVGHLEKSPDGLNGESFYLVVDAFAKVFPCE